MRIVFMGTPDFAVPALDALVAAEHTVIAAYTQPPRPGGRRGRELVRSAVHVRAEALGIPVRSPVSLRGEAAQAEFAALDADVAVVAAYGLILPQPVLDAPRLGCINIHGSLLPRWRGAAPVQRAILAGDALTGVTIMRMDAGLDTGPMLATVETPVGEKTAGALTAELAALGAALLVEVLGDLPAWPATVQPEGATYASKIDKAEAKLDFTRSAEQVARQVRALNPPGAYFEFAGERVRVLEAQTLPVGAELVEPPSVSVEEKNATSTSSVQTGVVIDDALTIACIDGHIRPTLVQRAGRGVMSATELLRGFPIPPGTQL